MDSTFTEFILNVAKVTAVAGLAGVTGAIRGNLSANETSLSPTLDTLLLAGPIAANCYIGARYGVTEEGTDPKSKLKYGAICGATAGTMTVISHYVGYGIGYLLK